MHGESQKRNESLASGCGVMGRSQLKPIRANGKTIKLGGDSLGQGLEKARQQKMSRRRRKQREKKKELQNRKPCSTRAENYKRYRGRGGHRETVVKQKQTTEDEKKSRGVGKTEEKPARKGGLGKEDVRKKGGTN